MSKYSKKAKEYKPSSMSEFLSESVFKKPVSEFLNKDIGEAIATLQKFFPDLEKKIRESVKEDIRKLKQQIEDLDEELAKGLPILSKHQQKYADESLVSIRKEISDLEKRITEKVTEKKKKYATFDDIKSIKDGFEITLKGQKENYGKDLNAIGENYRSVGIVQEGHKKQFKDVDKVLKKMADDIKKAGEIFEFGYSLGVSKNGTFQGNTGFLNFRNGTNTSVRVVANGGGFDIFIDSTGGGGGGLTPLLPTETPDGSRKTFTLSTASAKPSYIISDGVWMQATSKAGTVNWTWNNGTDVVSMAVAPQDDLLGIV